MRTLGCALLLLFLTLPASAEEVCWEEIAPGVDWCAFGEGNLQEEVHWARVDLTVPEISIRVTRDEEGPLTASQEAALKQSTVTINGDWDSASYNGPQGLSVGGGWYFEGSQDWDDNNPAGDWSFLACDASKQCRINPQNVLEQWTWNELNVIGGNGQRLVIDGVLQAPSYDSCTRPRSGVCLDITGEIMTLFVAEGDNSCGSSTGWTPWDFAQFVYDHGCYNGLMLDGGGSSDLVINQVHVTDRPPTEPAERSTHNHLSIIHQPGPVDPLCADLMNGKRCQGDTLITCQGGAAESGDCTVFGSVCEEGQGTAYCVLAYPGFCPNGANTDSCTDETVMSRCSLGQPTAFDCASIFGASCEDYGTGARCIQYGCIFGGDASWCEGEVAKTCAPDNSGEINLSFLTEDDCASQGQICQDGACITTDADDDGYASQLYGGADCDDSNGLINPAASESCDSIDNDCDGETDEGAVDAQTWYLDLDGDGYGNPNQSLASCAQPPAYVADGTDCNDTDFETHPTHDETCNLADDDCDDQIDEDATNTSTFYADSDGDGYGDPLTSKEDCFSSEGWVTDSGDCDDSASSVHPNALETADDGVDQDCDGADLLTVPSPDPDASGEDTVEDTSDHTADDASGPTPDDVTATEGDATGADDGSEASTDDASETTEDSTVTEEDVTETSTDDASETTEDTWPPTTEADTTGGEAATTDQQRAEPSTRGTGGMLPGTTSPPVEDEATGCQSTPSSPTSSLTLLLLLIAALARRRQRLGER